MEINFYESTPHMYLQTKQTIEVPSKIEVCTRYLNTGITVKEAVDFPIAELPITDNVKTFIPKVTEAIIKSAEAKVLPGAMDDVNFGISMAGLGDLVIKLHIFMGNRNVFIASSQFIAGYVMFAIFKNSFKTKTAKELKELLGIPLDDSRYKF